jgi:hypothetical protein
MRMTLTRSAVLVGLGLLAAAPATAETLACRLDPGKHEAYIARDIRIDLRGTDEARVADAIIASTGRRSVVATVDRSKPNRLRIVWDLSEVAKDPMESRPGPVKLSMRLSVERQGGAARLEVQDLLNRKYSYKALGRCSFQG